jgi:hypothetical protein
MKKHRDGKGIIALLDQIACGEKCLIGVGIHLVTLAPIQKQEYIAGGIITAAGSTSMKKNWSRCLT